MGHAREGEGEPMTSPAERMRRMRQRKAEGRIGLAVDVKLDRLALALSEDGFLAEWDDTDPASIEAALERMIEAYVADLIGPDVTA